MSWAGAVPALLLGALVLLLPGVLVLRALGQRGLAVAGAAPAVSVLLVGAAAVVAPRAGLGWGAAPVVLVTGGAALAAWLCSLLLGVLDARAPAAGPDHPERGPDVAGPRARRPTSHGPDVEGPDGRRVLAAAAGGLAIAAVLAAASVHRGLGRPDAVSQTFDGMFHLNALQRVADTSNASPESVARLTAPFAEDVYYPAGWHAVGGLLVEAGVPPVVAANALVLLIAGLVWPLACVLLVRRLAGARPLPVLLAAVLSQAFVAFPWLIDRWGVLWPQTLGTALLPVVLAALLHASAPAPVAGGAQPAAGERVRSLLVAVAALAGTALAHPGSFLLAVLLAAALLLATALPAALSPWRGGRAQWRALAATGAAAALVAAGAVAVGPRVFAMRTADWPATRGVADAVGEVLLNAPAGASRNVVVSALVLLGLVVALRRPRWRWLAVGHLLVAALDVIAAGTDAPFSQLLTAPWYNDRFRLAATVPVTGVALAVLGTLWVARLLRRFRSRHAVPAVAAALALAAAVPQVRGNGDQLGLTNVRVERHPMRSLVDPDEQRFLEDLRRHVPEGAVVAGTPWDGSAFAYALSRGVEVLYPHMRGELGEDARYLADHLQDAATDPLVCPMLEQRRVRYVLDMGRLWDPPALAPAGYTAFRLFQDRPGFRLAASEGDVRLYEITACG
ncbi:hypothetical protein CLV92_103285 [Kineococcus xinjiangensis]|uniref:Uncharacterized protein n=1 Tax=Kineococcus xinjiangensis TaxID=512762 RepID=A0A2S6IU98_9ACTN|nr:DUF6541 family protein [Kineococcus xinjiangensis]PPK97750.1 hypothetical protein CLV92_103285 [Kineococcus xinjiangensis]